MKSGTIVFALLLSLFLASMSSAFLFRRRRRRRCSGVACAWSWYSCSRSCGGGIQYSYITRHRNSCGPPCHRPASRSCNNHCCPVNCQWGAWGNWGSCSQTCGRGTSTRHRSYLTTASCGGSGCSGSSIETSHCNDVCCPQDCIWGRWNSWGECSLTCGGGTQSRQRSIATPSLCGGASCQGDTVNKKSCNDFCCPVNCALSPWSEWGSCNVSCGTGMKNRRRSVTQVEDCGGVPCIGTMMDEQICNTGCCPVDCQFGEWSTWSSCSSTCGPNGTTIRQRSIDVPPTCGGLCLGDLNQVQSCNRICLHEGEIDGTVCSCQTGWKGECCEEDVNECKMGTCGSNMNCLNTLGSYVCSCKTGFKEGDILRRNLNESHYGGRKKEKIENGGFARGSNYKEFEEKSKQNFTEESEGDDKESSSDFFEETKGEKDQNKNITTTIQAKETDSNFLNESWNEGTPFCNDIDECESDTCGANSNCRNTLGSFQCSCKIGYKMGYQFVEGSTEGNRDVELSGFAPTCVDINECEKSPYQCHMNATCTNMIGSYKCQCKPGFTGNGKQCEDVDECLEDKTLCQEKWEQCENFIGSYNCFCLYGRKDGKCVDRKLASGVGAQPNSGSRTNLNFLYFLLFVVAIVAVVAIIAVKKFKQQKVGKKVLVSISGDEDSQSSKSVTTEEKSL